MYTNKDDIINWLTQMGIKNYFINDDLSVDVINDVDITHHSLNEIPIQFNIVEGYFICYCNNLSSLKGCPKIVKKDFHCDQNPYLKSLKHLPIIYGYFESHSKFMNTNQYKNWKLMYHLRK